MFGYSNYSFPLYRNYNRFSRYSLKNPYMSSNTRIPINATNFNSQQKSKISNNYSPNDSIENSTKQNEESPKTEEAGQKDFLEILGIKLYFDDLIIISLLFFLYSEGVNDYYLFITLILLLLG